MKKLIIFLVVLALAYAVFVCEESIRLKNDYKSVPVIVLGKTKCSKDSWECYDKNGAYTENYTSLGFSLKREYLLDEDANEANFRYHIAASECWLFNKFLLWGWIS